MFIDPDTQQPYMPTPSYFLGCFDIYDREHTLGEELKNSIQMIQRTEKS